MRYYSSIRIDPALCRAILVAIESDPKAGSGQGLQIVIDGYDWSTIGQHVAYLWDEELIDGIDATNMQSPHKEILVRDITPNGRKYLDETEPEPPKRKIGF